MRETTPSQTASFVALVRALADRGHTTTARFTDPIAASLLSPGWSHVLGFTAKSLEHMPSSGRQHVIAQFEAIPLRVMMIDREIERAVGTGVRQLVVLGAGLDTRAFRMRCLSDVSVFEVDHPATQAYKTRKTAGLRPTAGSLHFVTVDFEHESLAQRLAQAGHRSQELTAWVWEGVVMYLSDGALRSTLGGVAQASAPGSVLLVNYHEPHVQPRSLAPRLLLSMWSEPQIGLRTPERMHQALDRAGFDVERDTRPSDWARAFGAQLPRGEIARVGHMVVARRRPMVSTALAR